MKLKQSLYIGAGFTQAQYPWVIPIIHGFCCEKKINNLIFEKYPETFILKNDILKNILSKYNIINLSKILPFWYKIKFIKYLILLLPSIFFFLNFNKKKILDKNQSWYNTQVFHSIWDTALVYGKNNSKPKARAVYLFISCISILESIFLANILIKKNVTYFFLNHCVYKFRAFLAVIRKNNLNIISQAAYNFHLQENKFDTSFSVLNNKILFLLKRRIQKNLILNYWKRRTKGRGYYDLSNHVFTGKINKKIKIPQNVIFLHIFQDSPYNVIDKNRIFVDYIDWFLITLNIIKQSNESWIIRIHPGSSRWGENLKFFIKNEIKKTKANNIILLESDISNNQIFKIAKRIITFSGTSHLEAACFGIKPIIIQSTQLDCFNKNYVLKPRSISEYNRLLIKSSNSKIFQLPARAIFGSKFLLFVREKVLTLREDLKQIDIYRSDKKLISAKNINNLFNNLPKNLSSLELNGRNLAKGYTHTFSKKYLNIL